MFAYEIQKKGLKSQIGMFHQQININKMNLWPKIITVIQERLVCEFFNCIG